MVPGTRVTHDLGQKDKLQEVRNSMLGAGLNHGHQGRSQLWFINYVGSRDEKAVTPEGFTSSSATLFLLSGAIAHLSLYLQERCSFLPSYSWAAHLCPLPGCSVSSHLTVSSRSGARAAVLGRIPLLASCRQPAPRAGTLGETAVPRGHPLGNGAVDVRSLGPVLGPEE